MSVAPPATRARGSTAAVARVLTLLALVAAPAGAQLALDVNASIAQGVDALRAVQQADGSFAEMSRNAGHVYQYPMGTTALAAYTLRKSGVRVDDPAVTSALAYLDELPLLKTYSVAVLVLALDSLGGEAHDERIQEAAAWLEQVFDDRKQQWGYPDRTPELSNTQLAVMALAAAARHGHTTPPRLWSQIIDGALTRQLDDGGFHYRADRHQLSSGGMATAGITTLHLAREQLVEAGQYDSHQRKAQEAIDRAWAWLDARYATSGNPEGTHGLAADRYPRYERDHPFHHYYLYGIERVATFSGRKTIGGLPWYRQGALELLSTQAEDGGWGSLPNTCLGLLFLRRATISGAHESPAADAARAGADVADGAGSDGDAEGAAEAASGDAGGVTWAYTTEEPSRKWTQASFNDDDWLRGPGGFGTEGAAGLVVRTLWTSSDLWVRRRFTWSPGEVLDVHAIHDDGVTIWINGELVGEGSLWSGNQYRAFPLSTSALRSLRPGENVIAAHVRDTGGARCLDIRLHGPPEDVMVSDHWRASVPEPEVPFLRRWLAAGPFSDKDGARMLDHEPPTGDARAGERLDGKPWTEVASLPGRLALGEVAGFKPRSFGYLATWLHVERDWHGYLWLGADAGLRAWVDGQSVAHLHEHRAAAPERLRAPLTLEAGAHLLLLGVEALDEAPALFARLADEDGSAPAGVRFSLQAEASRAGEASSTDKAPGAGGDRGADLVRHALWGAPPGAATLEALLAQLPVTTSRALALASADDLHGVAIGPADPRAPRWYAKPDSRDPAPQPPAGAKGSVSLPAPRAGAPSFLAARVTLASDAQTLTARVGRATGSFDQARVRLGLFDGQLRWLGQPLALAGEAPKRRPWQELAVELGPHAGGDALLLLEVSAAAGDPGATVFVDELELR